MRPERTNASRLQSPSSRAVRPKWGFTAGRTADQLRLLHAFAPADVLDAGVRKELHLERVRAQSLIVSPHSHHTSHHTSIDHGRFDPA